MKLEEKIRVGSKVRRIYAVPAVLYRGDDPQTPYARVLASVDVSQEDKAELREAYSYLDLVSLRLQINQLLDQLLDTLSDR